MTELVGIESHAWISTDDHFLSNKGKTLNGGKSKRGPSSRNSSHDLQSRAVHLSSTSVKTSKGYQLPSIPA
jgi:hypothetical protein